MQLHQIVRKNKNQKHKTVGRGGTRGKTSGRGTKGQNARAGRKKRPELRDIIKKLPKLRGYKFASIALKPVVINLAALAENFKAGETVNPQTLIEHKLLKTKKGIVPKVKILGTGEITTKLTVTGCLVSKSAQEQIEKVGGTIN